jgi:hypothetical protein
MRRVVTAVAVAVAALGGPSVSVARSSAPANPVVRHARTVAAESVPAYWAVASDGGVFAFGGLPFYGSMGGTPLNQPMVGMAPTGTVLRADGRGYWTVASDGGVFSFGSAQFHGSMGGRPLHLPMVGMAADPATGGYWTVASDGGVFAFDAPFFGSMGATQLNKPVVAMAATPDGGGYWLFASDGGVFCFGDAQFFGSMGGTVLNRPIVGAAAPDAGGYWLVASDGGVFTFGDAVYAGSLGNHVLSRPIAAMAAASRAGYWLIDTNGAVTAFGDGGYFGSAPQHIAGRAVGIADGPGSGAVANGAFPSGAYGFDVSVFQDNTTCTNALPSGHTIGIVEVTGAANAFPNPCLAHEAAWAGGGLNLYTFLTYGTDGAEQPGCQGDMACNWGYEASRYAFDQALAQGVNPLVTWWLDVEPANWSANTAENDQVIQGAYNALRDFGANNVGIYTSPLTWNGIAGAYRPAVPLWVAWYTNDPLSNCSTAVSYAASHGNLLPTGGVWVTQYTDTANGQSLDGDYAC